MNAPWALTVFISLQTLAMARKKVGQEEEQHQLAVGIGTLACILKEF